MRQHYVTFYSPGTFVSETTTKEIDSWDTHKAATMAKKISERYGARPYAFRFSTAVTRPPVPDGEGGTLRVEGRQVEQSGLHYISGEILTYDQVVSRNSPRDSILLSNMRGNRWPIVVETRSPYISTHPLEASDSVVDSSGALVARGDDARWAEYRAIKVGEWDRETEDELRRFRARTSAKR